MNNRDRAQELAMHLRLRQRRRPIRSFAHPRRHILRNFAHYSSARVALALVEDAAVTIAVVKTWANEGGEGGGFSCTCTHDNHRKSAHDFRHAIVKNYLLNIKNV